jgi:hypothetical protein
MIQHSKKSQSASTRAVSNAKAGAKLESILADIRVRRLKTSA